jgi:hypothetical protein
VNGDAVDQQQQQQQQPVAAAGAASNTAAPAAGGGVLQQVTPSSLTLQYVTCAVEDKLPQLVRARARVRMRGWTHFPTHALAVVV